MRKTNQWPLTLVLSSALLLPPMTGYKSTIPMIIPLHSSSSSLSLLTMAEDLPDKIYQNLIQRKNSFTVQVYASPTNMKEWLAECVAQANGIDDYTKNSIRSYRCTARPSGVDRITVEFEYEYFTSKAQEEILDQFVEQKLGDILSPFMSDHEKALKIHQWVVQHTTYETSEQGNTIYNAVFSGKAACHGISLLMQKMLTKAGVSSHIVNGSSKGQLHDWNLVQLSGRWYHLDATFDNPVPKKEGYVSYIYYGLTDSEIEKSHQWDPKGYPTASSPYIGDLLAYPNPYPNFFALTENVEATELNSFLTGKIVATPDSLVQRVLSAARSKNPEVKLLYSGNWDNDQVSVLNRLVKSGKSYGVREYEYSVQPIMREGTAVSMLTVSFIFM